MHIYLFVKVIFFFFARSFFSFPFFSFLGFLIRFMSCCSSLRHAWNLRVFSPCFVIIIIIWRFSSSHSSLPAAPPAIIRCRAPQLRLCYFLFLVYFLPSCILIGILLALFFFSHLFFSDTNNTCDSQHRIELKNLEGGLIFGMRGSSPYLLFFFHTIGARCLMDTAAYHPPSYFSFYFFNNLLCAA